MTDNAMPLVSVVMPIYNVERFLKQAVDSVISQTYTNIELIAVDDCSTDRSKQIMQEYAKRDSRIHFIENEKNLGVAMTRNRGIQAAKGSHIALLDSDDVWMSSKLERQMALLRSENADIAYCSMDMIDENAKKLRSFIVSKTTDFEEMLVRCFFSCSTVVIDANLLKAHPFHTGFYHEDLLLWLELLALRVKAVGETLPLAQYRQSASSRSNNKLRAAKHRWKLYRQALGMSFSQSAIAFVRYAFWGIVKYYA